MKKLRPYQEAAVGAVMQAYDMGYRRVLYTLPTGTGKCLGAGTPILMFNGTVKPVEEIETGDLLMGPDSTPRRVLSTCTGQEMMYQVIPVKGDPYTVNESHILSLKITPQDQNSPYPCEKGRTVNISIKEYLTKSKTFKHLAKGWKPDGVVFDPVCDPWLDPYFLGVWLGDGTSRNAAITTEDPEIVEWLTDFVCRQSMRIRATPTGKAMTYHICGHSNGPNTNPIMNMLQLYGVQNNKHIPHHYKVSSEAVRLQILAGLIDTDGSLTTNGYDLTFKVKQLAEDTVFLCRSVGLAAYMKPCQKTCTNNGKTGTYYRISITGHVNKIPVKIARKKASPRLQKKDVLVTGIRVEPIGVGDYYGFEIDGDRLFLLGDFTVTHNTMCFSELTKQFLLNDWKVLILAHRRELITQAYNAVKAHCELDMLEIGTEIAAISAPPTAKVVIGSIMTVKGAHRMPDFQPDAIILDECFPAGTMVDGRPIETIKEGDTVRSFNHKTRHVEMKRVTHLFKNPMKELVRVTLSNGKQIICTPNHPFYTIRDRGITGQWLFEEYVPACRLNKHHSVYCIKEEELQTNDAENLCYVRQPVRGTRKRKVLFGGMQSKENTSNTCPTTETLRDVSEGIRSEELLCKILFSGMPTKSQSAKENHSGKMSSVQQRSSMHYGKPTQTGTQWSYILLSRVPRKGKQPTTFRANEESKSYVQSCIGAEDGSISGRSYISQSGWQWGTNKTTNCTIRSVRTANRIPSSDCTSKSRFPVTTQLLQSRYSRPVLQTRNRNRRQQPQTKNMEVSGLPENVRLECIGVDSVEVLELGCGQGFDAMYSDDFVYNIEIEGNNNYFVFNTLVHNCHRAGGFTNKKICERYGVYEGNCYYVGCTATAKRGDKQSLYAIRPDGRRIEIIADKKTQKKIPADAKTCIFEKLVYEYPMVDAIEDGWLVPVLGHSVKTDTDISDVATGADGDFQDGQLEQAVNNTQRTNIAISAWKQIAEDRPTLVFCAGVKHAHDSADLWRQAGYTAEAIDGTTDLWTRDKHLQAFKDGKLQLLMNCAVFTEGTDLPNCSCVVQLRPTKSWNMYVQQSGRGTRPLPGIVDSEPDAKNRKEAIALSLKPDCIILDMVDISKGQDLCAAPSLLDLPANFDLQGQSVTAAKKLLDMFEDVKDEMMDEGCPPTYQEVNTRLIQLELVRNSNAETKEAWKPGTGGLHFRNSRPGYTVKLVSTAPGIYELQVTHKDEVLLQKASKAAMKDGTPYPIESYLDRAASRAADVIERHVEANMPYRGTLTRLSPKQVNVLRRNGYTDDQIDRMTYGFAKGTIDKIMREYNQRRENGDAA